MRRPFERRLADSPLAAPRFRDARHERITRALGRTLIAGALVTAACVLPLAAKAQGAPMPQMKPQGAGSFVCGGIGSDESTAMRAAMKSHPLSLLFARADGAYLAEVAVTIKDAGGATAMSMKASGPVCLVDLPAGRYTVEAATEGKNKSETVTLGGGSKTADFRF